MNMHTITFAAENKLRKMHYLFLLVAENNSATYLAYSKNELWIFVI